MDGSIGHSPIHRTVLTVVVSDSIWFLSRTRLQVYDKFDLAKLDSLRSSGQSSRGQIANVKLGGKVNQEGCDSTKITSLLCYCCSAWTDVES